MIRNSFPTRCIIASLEKYFCIQKLFSFFFEFERERERQSEGREGGKERKKKKLDCRQ